MYSIGVHAPELTESPNDHVVTTGLCVDTIAHTMSEATIDTCTYPVGMYYSSNDEIKQAISHSIKIVGGSVGLESGI